MFFFHGKGGQDRVFLFLNFPWEVLAGREPWISQRRLFSDLEVWLGGASIMRIID